MKIKYYLNIDSNGRSTLFVTGRYEFWLNKVKLNISPPLGTEIFSLEDEIEADSINLGFDFIEAKDFEDVLRKMMNKRTINDMGIHDCNLNIKSDFCLTLNHLYIGNNVNINMTLWNIIVNEVTFLSLKTFKGCFPPSIPSVRELTIWDDKNGVNEYLKVFSNISKLSLTNSNIEVLDLKLVLKLKEAHLAYCRKLKNVEVNEKNEIVKIIVKHCKNYIPTDKLKNIIINL